MRIACVGEAMVEVALDGSGGARVGFAGDVLNTGIYLRRQIAAAHEVAFVSVIGRDGLSDAMAGFIAAEGVSVQHLARHALRLPGLYTIATDAGGERSFTYWREGSAARTLFEGGDFAVLAGFDVIYLSAITLAILPEAVRAGLLAWIAGFRQRGGQFAFDSNYRPSLWRDRAEAQTAVEAAWRLCDLGLPSLDDERTLYGDADATAVVARLAGWGVRDGALKRGSAGPMGLDGQGGAYPAATLVVDTTAAGDSFNGGYLAARLMGGPGGEAMQAGHVCALRVIGYRGAIVPRAEWSALEEMLSAT